MEFINDEKMNAAIKNLKERGFKISDDVKVMDGKTQLKIKFSAVSLSEDFSTATLIFDVKEKIKPVRKPRTSNPVRPQAQKPGKK